jgi:ribosomal protein S15P/S13E
MGKEVEGRHPTSAKLLNYLQKKDTEARSWRLKPVILATLEVEIRRTAA